MANRVTNLSILLPPVVQKPQLGGEYLHSISRAASSPAASLSAPTPSSHPFFVQYETGSPKVADESTLNHSTQSLCLDSRLHVIRQILQKATIVYCRARLLLARLSAE